MYIYIDWCKGKDISTIGVAGVVELRKDVEAEPNTNIACQTVGDTYR